MIKENINCWIDGCERISRDRGCSQISLTRITTLAEAGTTTIAAIGQSSDGTGKSYGATKRS